MQSPDGHDLYPGWHGAATFVLGLSKRSVIGLMSLYRTRFRSMNARPCTSAFTGKDEPAGKDTTTPGTRRTNSASFKTKPNHICSYHRKNNPHSPVSANGNAVFIRADHLVSGRARCAVVAHVLLDLGPVVVHDESSHDGKQESVYAQHCPLGRGLRGQRHEHAGNERGKEQDR